MIKYERTPQPAMFERGVFQELTDKVKRFYGVRSEQRSQSRLKFDIHSSSSSSSSSREQELLSALKECFNDHCVYCDRNIRIEGLNYSVNAFRPPRGAMDLNDHTDEDYYHWISYEWENLYLSCKACASYKGHLFPVKGQRVALDSPLPVIYEKERPYFLDVCRDIPHDHIYYSARAEAKPHTKRGEVTIDRLHLNREELIVGRKKARTEMNKKLKLFVKVVEGKNESEVRTYFKEHFEVLFLKPNASFVGYRRSIFNDWVKKKRWYRNSLVKELVKRYTWKVRPPFRRNSSRLTSEQEKHALVNKISIRNFKNINLLNFSIEEPEEDSIPWVFLLGENGAGKSSILQAIALSLVGKDLRNKIIENSRDYLRYNQDGVCRVSVETSDKKSYNFSISQKGTIGHGRVPEADILVLAYGSVRLTCGKHDLKQDELHSHYKVLNLFDPLIGLTNAEKWLLDLPHDKNSASNDGITPFDRAAVAIKSLLHLDENINGSTDEGVLLKENDKIYYRTNHVTKVPLHNLSDGYSGIIGLACDIMKHTREFYRSKSGKYKESDYANFSGFIFIDEIGSHLHPQWKMRIVSSLKAAFTKMQFFITSHSPLCLRGVKKNEIKVVKYDYDKSNIVFLEKDFLPDPSTYRIDQLLTSDFFGLNSTIDPEDESMYNLYYSLLRKQAVNDISAEEKHKLLEVTEKVMARSYLGSNLREELVYHAIDKLLATRDPAQRIEDAKSKAINSVKEFWKTYQVDDFNKI